MLWAIDGNYTQFHNGFVSSHPLALPNYFKNIYQKEYFYWRRRKRAKPILSQETLVKCSDNLFDILGAWNHTTFPDEELIKATRILAECLKSYADYLLKAKEQMTINRETVQSYHDRVAICNPIESVKDVKEAYQKIDNHLHCVSEYEPILLDNNLLDIGVSEEKKNAISMVQRIKTLSQVTIFMRFVDVLR